MAPTEPPSRERFSSHYLPVSLLVLVAAFVLLWKLGAGSLAAWDEAIYAQVSKEMARGNDWLTPRWEYQLWFEKPPLFMWITALCYRLFGVSEFWARAPSAQRIILRTEDVQRLIADYDIHVLAEDGSLAYATIKHR